MACFSVSLKNFLDFKDDQGKKFYSDDGIGLKIAEGANGFATSGLQWDVWQQEIEILRNQLCGLDCGRLIFEYTIPRIGLRLDVVFLYKGLIFVLEFKGHVRTSSERSADVSNNATKTSAKNQVVRYAQYLRECHSLSRRKPIFPIVVTVGSRDCVAAENTDSRGVRDVSLAGKDTVGDVIRDLIKSCGTSLDSATSWERNWENGRYNPSPNIIESTINRFRSHNVKEIRESGAKANELDKTTKFINAEISRVKERGQHAIFFVTGVPGAGKTLVGLDVVVENLSTVDGKRRGATFLSGNMPLVEVLSTALQRDAKLNKGDERTRAGQCVIANDYTTMINHLHAFRDPIIKDLEIRNKKLMVKEGVKENQVAKGFEHLIVFDEAQRAFDKRKFTQKRQFQRGNNVLQHSDFPYSEPGFMLWAMRLHKDWGAIVCLVGNGQEINDGETGIEEWFKWLLASENKDWRIYVSDKLQAIAGLNNLKGAYLDKMAKRVQYNSDLHLAVPRRSRSEKVDAFVEFLLALDAENAFKVYSEMSTCKNSEEIFPLYCTRSIESARNWLRMKRGDGSDCDAPPERAGLLMSSNAYRLRPIGFPALTRQIFDKTANWFLDGKNNINSSDFLEIALHEMFVQGLELDWVGLLWDADFRPPVDPIDKEWECYDRIVGNDWAAIAKNKKKERKYLLNAYRVLLTRARKGMVIVVPVGDKTGNDPSRNPEYYNGIYEYLKTCGIKELP